MYLLKSRLHMAVAFVLLAAIIFILHQMLSSVAEPTVSAEMPYRLTLPYGQIQADTHQSPFRHEMPYKSSFKFQGEKLIHLDLKGAPPTVDYLRRIFPLFKQLGATGLLIEYEDMFPFYDELANIPAYNAYNRSEISAIQEEAKKNGLMVMPLLQTFGHMEFVLKLQEYRPLREVDVYPQVVCPTNPATKPLLYKMIDQVVLMHPGITHLHIGSDEVYHIGRCNRCQKTMSERGWSKDQLFLSHVSNITDYIRRTHPTVRPVMWDDEFRTLSEDAIAEFGVAQMVDIMIWKYTPNVAEFITDEILDKYTKLFVGIWIATAFKGASGPDSLVPDVRNRLENHRAWLELVSRWQERMTVRGVALTGWQRYDHFATLCELLPVSIPSLAVCLRFIDGYPVDDGTMTAVLGCDFTFAWGSPYESNVHTSPECGYAGSELYILVGSLLAMLTDINSPPRDVNRGWFSQYQIIHNFSSPAHVEESTNLIEFQRANLDFLESRLRKELLQIYDQHTVEEWVSTFIVPAWTKLIAWGEARDRLMAARSWPRRPLDRYANDASEIRKICDGSMATDCVLLGH